MKRGLINLLHLEIQQALNYITKNEENKLLISKLEAGLKNGQQTQVQVSEEELEILMDNLPIPKQGEDQALNNLRTKVQMFLSKLRSG